MPTVNAHYKFSIKLNWADGEIFPLLSDWITTAPGDHRCKNDYVVNIFVFCVYYYLEKKITIIM